MESEGKKHKICGVCVSVCERERYREREREREKERERKRERERDRGRKQSLCSLQSTDVLNSKNVCYTMNSVCFNVMEKGH